MTTSTTSTDVPADVRLHSILVDFIGPLIVFSALAVLLTYPVSLNPGDMVIGRPFDDAFEYVWYLWWYRYALLDAGISPLFQPGIFYPVGWDLSFSAFPPIYPALAVPITATLGAVKTYNLYILFAIVFAALGTYRLVRALGGDIWGSVFAGIAFAFFPQRAVYFGGHLNFLTGSMWLPWIFYSIVRAKQSDDRRLSWMVFAGFSFAMSLAGSWHFIFLSGSTVAIFLLVYLWRDLSDNIKRGTWVWPLVSFGITLAIVIGPFLLDAYRARELLGGNATFDFNGINVTSVSLERFLLPSAMNPLFIDISRLHFPLWNGQDSVVTFGYIVLALALFYLWFVRPRIVAVKAFVAVVIFCLLMMLGLTLHWMGKPIALSITTTATLEVIFPELVVEGEGVLIPMPAFLVYKLLPAFRTFHSFSRWGLGAMMGLAVLSGLGLSTFLVQRNSRFARGFFTLVAVAILLVEFNTLPLLATTNINDVQRGVDRWLADQPEGSVIIEYPFVYTNKGQTLYYSTIHQQPTINGAGSFFPPKWTSNRPILEQWPAREATDLLAELGVRFVIVNVFATDEVFENETLPAILANESVTLVEIFDEQIGPVQAYYLFELNAGNK